MNQIYVHYSWRIVLLLAAAAPALGQTPTTKGIEEIVVTAQKTEQNVLEVPISITVLPEQFLREKGATDFHDVAIFAPNVTVDNSSSFPDVRIRGIGSPLSNKAFEQSVGLAIDGINYGRVPYFQGPLFDLDRVEILRGPQGTLFGKNVTAGLFNVVTKKPSDEFTGYFSGELGELADRRFEVAVGGPMLPKKLNFRLSALTDERDGTVDNTTADVVRDARDRMIERERRAIRVQVGVPDFFGGNLVVAYERVHFEIIGGGWELRRVTPGELAFYRHFDPQTDTDPENWRGSVDYPDFARRDIETYVANLSYPIRDWTLYAVAGHSTLDVKGANDLDFGPAPMLFTKSEDTNPQTSFELRLASPQLRGLLGVAKVLGFELGSSEITTGFFLERRNLLNSALAINLNIPTVGQFLVAQGVPTGVATDQIPNRPILPAGIVLPIDRDLIDSLTAAGVGQEESTGYFDQHGLALAGFSQLAWRPFERWSIETGLRYTWERKKAHFARRFTQGTGIAFNAIAGQSEFDVDRERSEGALTPQVAVRWSWTDDVNLFAKWATGYKAGGFNELNSNGRDGLSFKPERVTAWETGAKMRLLDDTAVLNVSLFWNDVTDMQVFTARPSDLVATVENAGKARARGVEVDAVWQPCRC